ncbi:acetyltransferase [Muriicola soli]|uniref:Acetyltransferase n=1 Tax=Muriicola soli TaxID=2507538 RepID=A0A411EBN9_9FLAO|nr:acetyltransferase [Muriicola soli]QBA64954.1 acetyltransferase [Muriicola soli]
MKNVVIFGASGHGSVVMDCIEKEGKYKIVGFIDSIKKKGHLHNGYQILGTELDLPYIRDKYYVFGGIVAIGDNWTRKVIVNKISKLSPGFKFISTIHPFTSIGKNVTIGNGVVVAPGVVINANSSIRNHCILNTYSSLDHDSVLQEFSSLAPRVCTGGNFKLGKYSAVCLGSYVIENVSIDEHSVIGAGSLVLKDVGKNVVVYGSPAEIIRKREVGDPYLANRSESFHSQENTLLFDKLFRIP